MPPHKASGKNTTKKRLGLPKRSPKEEEKIIYLVDAIYNANVDEVQEKVKDACMDSDCLLKCLVDGKVGRHGRSSSDAHFVVELVIGRVKDLAKSRHALRKIMSKWAPYLLEVALMLEHKEQAQYVCRKLLQVLGQEDMTRLVGEVNKTKIWEGHAKWLSDTYNCEIDPTGAVARNKRAKGRACRSERQPGLEPVESMPGIQTRQQIVGEKKRPPPTTPQLTGGRRMEQKKARTSTDKGCQSEEITRCRMQGLQILQKGKQHQASTSNNPVPEPRGKRLDYNGTLQAARARCNDASLQAARSRRNDATCRGMEDDGIDDAACPEMEDDGNEGYVGTESNPVCLCSDEDEEDCDDKKNEEEDEENKREDEDEDAQDGVHPDGVVSGAPPAPAEIEGPAERPEFANLLPSNPSNTMMRDWIAQGAKYIIPYLNKRRNSMASQLINYIIAWAESGNNEWHETKIHLRCLLEQLMNEAKKDSDLSEQSTSYIGACLNLLNGRAAT